MKSIPYGKQHIDNDDIEGILETLKSDFLTQGPKVNEFENKFAKYIGVKYAVAVSNATSALHLSVLAKSLKKIPLRLSRLKPHFLQPRTLKR